MLHRFAALMASLACSIAVLTACGTTPAPAGLMPPSTGDAPDTVQARTDQPALWPAFPGPGAPLSVIHSTSDSEVVVGGSEFTEEQGEQNEPGPSGPEAYIIAPGAEDDLAWALYGIGGFDPDRPAEISIELNSAPLLPGGDDPLPLGAWIGLANYSSYSWDWFGPYEESVSLQINSAAVHDRYVSSENNFYYTVVTDASGVDPGPGNPDGTTAVEIIASTTSAVDATSGEYHETTPHYPIDSESGVGDGKQGSALDPATQFVTVFWSHLEDDASPANEAAQYDVYRRRLGTADGLALLGSVAAPAEQFVDPTDTRPLIGAVTPGETYEYYVVARNAAGATPVSHSGAHQIPLLGPAGTLATYGLSTGWIRCNWERSEGAVEYELYRDNQDEPLVNLGDVNTWRDQDVPDTAEHTYWIRGVNKYGTPGEFSQPAIGRLNAAPIAEIDVDPAMLRGVLPHTVQFDGSSSTDPDFTGAGNDITQYEWDADGDGTYEHNSTSPGYSYTYNTATGSFNARLRVTDMRGATGTATIEIQVNVPPVASIFVDPLQQSGTEPHNVQFMGGESYDPDHAGSGNGIALYEWDADGDGGFEFSSTSPDYDYVYDGVFGDFNAVLRVTDADGETGTTTVQIHVNSPPAADLQASDTNPYVNQLVIFNAGNSTDADGAIVNYEWDLNGNGVFNENDPDFNEQSFEGLAIAEAQFPDPIFYTVTVRVTDDEGATDTASIDIDVRI
jgi:hypothetical protein